MSKIPKKMGKPSKYEAAFKIAISREYLESDLGYMRLGTKYGIPTDTVRDFVRWYRSNYPDPPERVVEAVADSVEAQKPIAANAELQNELEEARLKIAGLEMLIEIANKELGIDIIKKRGTKQSWK